MITWSRAWRLLLAVVIVGVYVPYFHGLVHESQSNPYAGHVLFVPALASIVLLIRRREFRRPLFRTTRTAATVLSIASALLVVGYSRGDLWLQTLSFVATVAGLALSAYGAAGVRRAAFVLAFLLLMMPPPREAVAAISPTVQHFVATACGTILRVIGVPVIQYGTILSLVGVALEVAEECSGLRFLPILLVFVGAFARVTVGTWRQQALLIAVSIPVAVIANVTRVVLTGAGTYFIAPYVATGPSHYYIGKACWLGALVVMIGLAVLLRTRSEPGRLRQSVAMMARAL